MANENVLMVKSIENPSEEGKHFRLLCMTGNYKGTSYFLKSKRIILGRGKTADIFVHDTKSSREHAELKMVNGFYYLTDLGSQNGIFVNDEKIRQKKLYDGDKIIIGHTVYKFSEIVVGKNLTLVDEDEDEDENEERNKEKEEHKRKRLIYGFLMFAAIYFLLDMLGDSPTNEKASRKKKDVRSQKLDENFTEILKRQQKLKDREVSAKLGAVIHRGLREYREGNYFRAIEEFELALVLSPNNGRVKFYLDRTKQRLDEDVAQFFIKGKRAVDALKYAEAKIAYCSIIRWLKDYPEDERYKDAEDNIRYIEKTTGKLEGEIKCFEGK